MNYSYKKIGLGILFVLLTTTFAQAAVPPPPECETEANAPWKVIAEVIKVENQGTSEDFACGTRQAKFAEFKLIKMLKGKKTSIFQTGTWQQYFIVYDYTKVGCTGPTGGPHYQLGKQYQLVYHYNKDIKSAEICNIYLQKEYP